MGRLMGEYSSQIPGGRCSNSDMLELRRASPSRINMPRQSTRLEVTRLRDKLKLVCAELGWQFADLARELHVAPSTLSEYIAGVDLHKSKLPNSMPRDKLERLAHLVQKHGRAGITRQQAFDAWLARDKEVLASMFRRRRIENLAELLSGRSSELIVQASVVPLRMRRALMPEDGEDRPVTGDLVRLNRAICGIRFNLIVEPGARLFCACSIDGQWIQLVPGPRHAGHVENASESVPRDALKNISFGPPAGRHRFVFIQARAPVLQARNPELGLKETLQGAEIEDLARQLAESDSTYPWKWTEVVVDVE